MGAVAFVFLLILGFVTAVIGSIVGLVDAFRVSPVWGLLSLLIPFALLVFCLKFWNRKWARNSFIMSVSGLVMMLLSTPFLGAFNTQRASRVGDPTGETFPIEEGVVEEGIVETVPIPEAVDPGTEEFAEPLVPVAPQLSSIARADLIQSTDPNERIQQINDGRTDPFAVVPIPPAPQVVAPPPPVPAGPPAPTAGPPQPGAPGTPGAPGSPVATAPGTPGAPGATTPGGPGVTPGAPGQLPPPPALAPLPPLPQPAQAEAVQVSGVMTIGNQNFAVVQTPTGSQYVRAGQRIANGQVLVKRIDMRGSDPMVVFEENGIEVSRPVGAPPAGEEVAVNGAPLPGIPPQVQF